MRSAVQFALTVFAPAPITGISLRRQLQFLTGSVSDSSQQQPWSSLLLLMILRNGTTQQQVTMNGIAVVVTVVISRIQRVTVVQ